jgi:hypothetical protein
VNGGYFDPALKFGVNCYGMKPTGANIKFPLPPPGTDTSVFDAKVKTFKDQMKDFFLAPFSRTTWSGDYGTQFAQQLGGLGEATGDAATAAAAKAEEALQKGTVGVNKTIVNPASVGVPAASGSSVNASATAASASSLGGSFDTFLANNAGVQKLKAMLPAAVAAGCVTKDACPSIDMNNAETPKCQELKKQAGMILENDIVSVARTSGVLMPGGNGGFAAIERILNAVLGCNPTPPTGPTATPYDNGKVYKVGDVVTKDGQSYVMIDGIGAAGYPPPRPTNWKPVN